MLTNTQEIAARLATVTPASAHLRGLWTRAVGQFQSAVCGLHGHDPLLHFEQGRMFLRCTSCGHETPGWDTGERRPRPRFSGDPLRHQLQESPARSRTIA